MLTRDQTSISVSDLESIPDLAGITGMLQHPTTMVTITGIIQAIHTGMVTEVIIHMGIITILIARHIGITVVAMAQDIIPDMDMTTTMVKIETNIMGQGPPVILDHHREDHQALLD